MGLPEPIPRVGSDSEALVLWRATWPLDHYTLQGSGGKTVGPSKEGGAVLDPFRVQAPELKMSVSQNTSLMEITAPLYIHSGDSERKSDMSKLAWLGPLTQSHTLYPKEKWAWHPPMVPAPGWGSTKTPFFQAWLPCHLLGQEADIHRASATQPRRDQTPAGEQPLHSPSSTHSQQCAAEAVRSWKESPVPPPC